MVIKSGYPAHWFFILACPTFFIQVAFGFVGFVGPGEIGFPM
jgi:hypothetical protein